jgi:hypothetical protein
VHSGIENYMKYRQCSVKFFCGFITCDVYRTNRKVNIKDLSIYTGSVNNFMKFSYKSFSQFQKYCTINIGKPLLLL